MLTFLSIIIVLGIYFVWKKDEILKDKKERNWVIALSFLAVSFTIMLLFNFPIYMAMKFLNETLGEFTKHVVKV